MDESLYSQVPITETDVREWLIEATNPIDLVTSWDGLHDTYNRLGFVDKLTDSERMAEYGWIVHQLNKYLSRQKNLINKPIDEILTHMRAQLTTARSVSERQQLAYYKYKTQWLYMVINTLEGYIEQVMRDIEPEGSWLDDDWSDE